MDSQRIEFFADEAGIGDKNTVSNGPDDGANNFMAACFWRVKRHGTTAEAVGNGLAAFHAADIDDLPEAYGSAGALNVGGHGNEGVLETGMGQSGPFDENQWIATWTEHIWGPQLDRIKPSSITLVSIWSCHTGAGADGAELLFAMAKRCGRAVRARTGYTYTDGKKIWFEKGSVWQVASPSNKPSPIPAPTPHFFGTGPMQIGKTSFTSNDIEQVKISISGTASQPIVLQGASGGEILMSLINPVPLAMEGIRVAGFVTGQFEIALKGEGADTMKFIVYNDRLAVEESGEIGFYLTASLNQLVNTIGR